MDTSAAGSGDFQEAFRGLFLVAFQVTHRILGDITRAEDAAAEATARALVDWRRVGRMEHRNAWIARVAGNVAIDEVRRLNRRREVPDRSDGPPVPDRTDETALRMALGAEMARLSTRQREVIALRYLADFDEAEVSRALGISVNSVKKHAARGKAALRARLNPTLEVNLALE
ncbi:MAG TPA: sigma-70 family RNA polymerase sigma factor [Acidimicrobiales bacterium]|jgi:RNA polymerase sigma factor (sigma-70 family)|nr:sigma-70 family RNA polymerase sigma factor [Acidimicrobiales bacterium]